MSYFFLALGASAVWAVSNHIDKYLLSKYFKIGGVGALFIFSSVIYLFILPIIAIFQPDILNISAFNAVVMVFAGMIDTAAILIYLYALQKDEASIVVPLFQVMPVFLYILGYIFLGEELSKMQIAGSLLVMFGAVFIS